MYHSSEALQKLGYRLTSQRLVTLAALTEGQGDPIAEQIHRRIQARYGHIDLSTIYRNLQFLKRLGPLMEPNLGQGRAQYHLGENCHHHHLICRQCGATLKLEEDLFLRVKEAILQEHGFAVEFSHFAVFGRCRQYRKKAEGN